MENLPIALISPGSPYRSGGSPGIHARAGRHPQPAPASAASSSAPQPACWPSAACPRHPGSRPQHALPPLPYPIDALDPVLSASTLATTTASTTRPYVDNPRRRPPAPTAGLPLSTRSDAARRPALTAMPRSSSNAARVRNHNFCCAAYRATGRRPSPPADGKLPPGLRRRGRLQGGHRTPPASSAAAGAWLVADSERLRVVRDQQRRSAADPGLCACSPSTCGNAPGTSTARTAASTAPCHSSTG